MKKMELEEAENNLRAMRLLYRLLEHNSPGLQNTTSEDIIAKEAGISKKPFTSEPVASLQSRPLLAAKSSHCSLTYPTHSRSPSRNDEQPQSMSPTKKAGPRLSKCNISDKGTAIRKALFNVGEETSTMEQNLVKAANLPNDKPIFPNKESSQHEQKHILSTFHVDERSKQSPDTFDSKAGELREFSETSLPYRGCEIESSPSGSSRVEAHNEEGHHSSDLFSAIKRIESRILALQLYSSLVSSKKNGTGNKSIHRTSNSESPMGQKKEVEGANPPSYRKSLLEGDGLMNLQANQLASKSENLITAKDNGITIQRRSQKGEACRGTLLASRVERLLNQNGFRPPAQNMAMENRPQSLNCPASGNDGSVNNDNECIQGIRIPLNSKTADSTNKDKPARRNPLAPSETHREEKQPLHHHIVPREAQPHRRSGELKIPPHGYRNRKVLGNIRTHKMRTSLPYHHDSEEEFCSSSSSSSPARWTSNQSSAIYSSESEGNTGDSPGDMVSKTCEDSSAGSSSHRSESSNSVRSWHRRRDPEKTTGRLRRLKNKLRLIFHHHHHLHHHHHHDEDDGKMSKANHSHSIWTRIFHGKNKHKLLANGKFEKTKGGAIVKGSHGKQVGQFHGLLERILKHIRHSKKQKPSKIGRNPKHGNKKKFHWWKMLRHHRGVKVNNGGRLKVGFKTQKRLKN